MKTVYTIKYLDANLQENYEDIVANDIFKAMTKFYEKFPSYDIITATRKGVDV